jgi:hypothetical protein
MYKINKIINEVKSYDFKNEVYINAKGFLDFSGNEVIRNITKNCLLSFGKFTILLDAYNKPIFYSDIINNNYINLFRISSVKFPFIDFYKKEHPRKYGVYDYEKQKVLFETTEWIGRDIIGEHIFSDYQGIITCRRVYSAAPLWQFDLAVLGTYTPLRSVEAESYEVKKFLGAWHNELLVACSNGLILCLDVRSGKETRRFHNCPGYRLGSVAFTHLELSEIFVLDEEKDILFALYAYYYIEIDLHTANIGITNLEQEMRENKIGYYRRSNGYAWDNEYIYTIGEVAEHNSAIAKGDRSLVAFGRGTKKTAWQHVFENDSINTDIPQVSGDKLYQLTANKVLYIFEREGHMV